MYSHCLNKLVIVDTKLILNKYQHEQTEEYDAN